MLPAVVGEAIRPQLVEVVPEGGKLAYVDSEPLPWQKICARHTPASRHVAKSANRTARIAPGNRFMAVECQRTNQAKNDKHGSTLPHRAKLAFFAPCVTPLEFDIYRVRRANTRGDQ